MTVREVMKSIIPVSAVALVRRRQMIWTLRREARRDARDYARYAAQGDRHAAPTTDIRHLETQLTKDYHRVEKGLALRAPKRPFGADVARRLDAFLPAAQAVAGDSTDFIVHAAHARDALRDWNELGIRSDLLSPAASTLPASPISSDEFASFVEGRRSVRDFDAERVVPIDILERAIRIAGNTPSVCNRQPWSAHIYEGRTQVRDVLSFQNGNRAFRDELNTVIVITVDARLFSGAEERNQPWIEGGLFAAHLSLALHSVGVATCLLNMSATHDTMDRLRGRHGIDPNEMIIMMMAVGYPPEGHRVARSPRRASDELVRRHHGERE